ncbi:MAG TPA: hypothetical protein VF482_01000 [Trebonia sp.]
MSFRPSRPGSTGRADDEPAETDPAAETKPVADTPPTSDTADDALSTSSAQDTAGASPATAGGPRPSFQPRGAAGPVSIPAFTGPPDDTPLEGPLLPDAAQLRGNWQRIMASFVDDPRGSVAEAAALVDHAAQALAGALQQRQRRLRESWDTADGATGGAALGTEELRVAMQRYRTLFNHICQP